MVPSRIQLLIDMGHEGLVNVKLDYDISANDSNKFLNLFIVKWNS